VRGWILPGGFPSLPAFRPRGEWNGSRIPGRRRAGEKSLPCSPARPGPRPHWFRDAPSTPTDHGCFFLDNPCMRNRR